MRKQFRYSDGTFGIKYLHIYHDGKHVETKRLWIDDFWEERDKLEAKGYTYGFSNQEAMEAHQRYQYIKENLIEEA